MIATLDPSELPAMHVSSNRRRDPDLFRPVVTAPQRRVNAPRVGARSTAPARCGFVPACGAYYAAALDRCPECGTPRGAARPDGEG